jgi:hypothetical protein
MSSNDLGFILQHPQNVASRKSPFAKNEKQEAQGPYHSTDL